MARPTKFADDVLLTRAMKEFWRRGYSATSIRDLEDAMSLKAPSIYRRYHSKEGLFEACVTHYLELVIGARVERYLNTSQQPMQDVRAFFDSAIDSGPKDNNLIGCLVINSAIESPAVSHTARDLIRAGIDRVGAALAAECERAHEVGQLTEDPHLVGDRLQMDFLGLMVLARSGTSAASLQQRVDQTFEPYQLKHNG